MFFYAYKYIDFCLGPILQPLFTIYNDKLSCIVAVLGLKHTTKEFNAILLLKNNLILHHHSARGGIHSRFSFKYWLWGLIPIHYIF